MAQKRTKHLRKIMIIIIIMITIIIIIIIITIIIMTIMMIIMAQKRTKHLLNTEWVPTVEAHDHLMMMMVTHNTW